MNEMCRFFFFPSLDDGIRWNRLWMKSSHTKTITRTNFHKSSVRSRSKELKIVAKVKEKLERPRHSELIKVRLQSRRSLHTCKSVAVQRKSYSCKVSSNQPSLPQWLYLLSQMCSCYWNGYSIWMERKRKKTKEQRECCFCLGLTDARIAIDSFEDLITRVWHQSTLRTNAAKHRSKAKLGPGTLTRTPERKQVSLG